MDSNEAWPIPNYEPMHRTNLADMERWRETLRRLRSPQEFSAQFEATFAPEPPEMTREDVRRMREELANMEAGPVLNPSSIIRGMSVEDITFNERPRNSEWDIDAIQWEDPSEDKWTKYVERMKNG